MKRRESHASDSTQNWLILQWTEAVHSLQTRPASRRGEMLISDEALENCLQNVSEVFDSSSRKVSLRQTAAA